MVAWVAAETGARGARPAVALAPWLALAALLVAWLPGRGVGDLDLGQFGWGAQAGLRADAVTIAFGVAILLPAGVLFVLQPRPERQSAAACATLAAATLAVESSSLVVTGFAISAVATFGGLAMAAEGEAPPRAWWVLVPAALVVGWAGADLQAVSQTAAYAAVPVNAFTPAVAGLLLLGALGCSGVLPFGWWPAAIWKRSRLEAAGIVAAATLPLGLYLVMRAYQLGPGQLPGLAISLSLAAIGAAVALGAGLRAQAAPTRRAYLGEIQPGLAGCALTALGVGTGFGLSAGVTVALAMAAMAAILPLVPDSGRGRAMIAVATGAGVPPTLVFGARLLAVQSAVESRTLYAFVALGLLGAWLLTLAGGARSFRVPAGELEHAHPASRAGVVAILAFSIVAGAGLALIEAGIAAPAAAAVGLPFTTLRTGGAFAVVTGSGGWAALTLGGPLLLVATLTGLAWRRAGSPEPPARAPEPFFPLPRWTLNRPAKPSSGWPVQVDRRRIEAALAGSNPLFWAVLIGVVTIAAGR